MNYLVPQAGRGKELQELLRKELGVPEGATAFSVRFAHDDVVRVECTYLPVDRSAVADITTLGADFKHSAPLVTP